MLSLVLESQSPKICHNIKDRLFYLIQRTVLDRSPHETHYP